MTSSATATCASETVPARSLANLTAAPQVCLPTGSSRRVAPPGRVPRLPHGLWRQPVASPRTAEPRGPRDPPRAATDCALSVPATMLLRARLGLHCQRADCHRVEDICLTTGAPCCTLGLPACPCLPQQATARRSTRSPGVRAALRWRQTRRMAADQLHCASGVARRDVTRKRFSLQVFAARLAGSLASRTVRDNKHCDAAKFSQAHRRMPSLEAPSADHFAVRCRRTMLSCLHR